MSNNTTHFGNRSDVRVMHIAEILVALNESLMLPDDIFVDREERRTPDNMRVMLFPPTKREAQEHTAIAMMDEPVTHILNDIIEDSDEKLKSLRQETNDDGMTSIVPQDDRRTADALIGVSTISLMKVVFDEALLVISEQHPQFKEVDIDDLDFLIFSISELQAKKDENHQVEIEKLRKEATNLLQSKVHDLKNRHFGSEWVQVRMDHGLVEKIEENLKRTKSFLGIVDKGKAPDGMAPE